MPFEKRVEKSRVHRVDECPLPRAGSVGEGSVWRCEEPCGKRYTMWPSSYLGRGRPAPKWHWDQES